MRCDRLKRAPLFYDQGTTNQIDVFRDRELTDPFDQPIEANSSGEIPSIFLGSFAYTVEIKDPIGCTIRVYQQGDWQTCPVTYLTSTQLLREYPDDGPVLALLDGELCPAWYHASIQAPPPIENLPLVVTGNCKTWERC